MESINQAISISGRETKVPSTFVSLFSKFGVEREVCDIMRKILGVLEKDKLGWNKTKYDGAVKW